MINIYINLYFVRVYFYSLDRIIYIKYNTNFFLPDMAAIPDFVSGAMENWGLVTYREARLLFDNKTTSTANKEDIVLVIAHEFAHMWFGNLGNHCYLFFIFSYKKIKKL